MKYKTFLAAVEDYLNYRRKLGFALRIEGEQLCRFARYADKIITKGTLTTELAIQWAKLPQKCRPIYWARRLDIVRRFARHIKLMIPKTQIPPEGILGPSTRRPTPHIYSEKEITAIMRTARNLTPLNGLRPHTYVTLFGLLASTGIRISEALHLSMEDFNFTSGTINIVDSKYHKGRIIPIHPTTVDALKSYVVKRNNKYPIPKTTAFFISEQGTALRYYSVLFSFRQIVFSLGWRKKSGDRGPRIHDLRHTFTVRRILEWYRNGDNVQQKISYLSTYLGHVNIIHTYWYLTGIPELMAIAASRFERFIYKKEDI